MKAELIKSESKEIVIEFEDRDLTLPELISGRLVSDDDVKFAGVAQDHPEVGKPRLIVKTDKHNALPTLSKALDGIEEDLTDLKSQLSKKR